MGWLFGWDDRKSLANHLIEGNGVKTLRHCWKGNNLWTVQEHTAPEITYDGQPNPLAGTTRRFVCLYMCKGRDTYDRRTGKYDPHGWGYKDVDEGMGPYHTNCPVSYIELVEAHEAEFGYEPNQYAKEWRAAVRQAAERQKLTLTEGQHIRVYGRDYTVGAKRRSGGYYIWPVGGGPEYVLPRRMYKAVVTL